MSEIKKNKYLLRFLKSGYWLISLALCCVCSAVTVFGYRCGLLTEIAYNPNYSDIKLFSIVTLGFFFLITLIYVIFTSKKNKIKITDSFAFFQILYAVAVTVYYLTAYKSITTSQLIFVCGLGIIGIALLLLSLFGFNPDCATAKPDKNVCAYYKSITEKFSFAGITALAFILVCFFVCLLSGNVSFSLTSTKKTVLTLLCAPLLLYLTYSAGNKKTGVNDLFALSGIISAPVLITFLFTAGKTNDSVYANIVICILLTGAVFYTLIRWFCFDYRYVENEYPVQTDFAVLYYLKKSSRSFGVLPPLAIAGIISAFFVLFPVKTITDMIDLSNGYLSIKAVLLPLVVVILPIAFLIVYSLVVSILSIFKKDVSSKDFFVYLLVGLSVLSFLTLKLNYSLTMLFILLALTFFSLSVFFVRAKRIFYK